MKKDFDKILTERPSRGGCGKERIRENRHETRQKLKDAAFDEDIESQDFRSMGRVHSSHGHGDRKESSCNYGPLYRYLKKQIGKSWNDVYSDIKNNIKLNNWDVNFILGRVETNTYMDGDTIMIGGYTHYPIHEAYYELFYVDPRDGTLQFVASKNRYRRNKNTPRNNCYIDKKNPLVQYHKMNGIWYEIKMREATELEKTSRRFKYNNDSSFYMVEDKLVDEIKRESNIPYLYAYYAEDLFWKICHVLFDGPYLPISKRQISSKEIKRIESLINERDNRTMKKAV